jgi:glucose/arabinose dehydrogenase
MKALSLAALSLALLSTTSLGQGTGSVLSGKDAFGGWKDDAPGVTRKLSVDDLEQPFVSKSASNTAQPVPMKDGQLPKVPAGYKVELVAKGIDTPRAIRFAPNGDLFVANSDDGQVLVFRFDGDKPTPTKQSIYIDKLNQPYGIAFYPADKPHWVYIAESDGLKRYPYKDGDMQAPKGTGPDAAPQTILDGIPSEHHWTRDVVFSPDGKTMYFSVGSGSNVGDGTMDKTPEGGLDKWIAGHPLGEAWGKEEGRAAVWTYTPDGKDGKVFATGLRNCAGMTLQPATGQVWCVVNERDELGDNIPFEYATAVQQGAFYGWPWYYNGGHSDPRWTETSRDDLKGKVTVGDVLFQAHSAPLNIAFETGDGLGPDAKGDAFVAMHGSWNRNTRTGYKIVELDVDTAGKPTGTYTDFVTGFVLSDEDVWGRPVGVAFDKAGNLFFSEDGSGTIWKVSKQ